MVGVGGTGMASTRQQDNASGFFLFTSSSPVYARAVSLIHNLSEYKNRWEKYF